MVRQGFDIWPSELEPPAGARKKDKQPYFQFKDYVFLLSKLQYPNFHHFNLSKG